MSEFQPKPGETVAVKATIASEVISPDGRVWVSYGPGWATHPEPTALAPWAPAARIAALEALEAACRALLDPKRGADVRTHAWTDAWTAASAALAASLATREENR